jgi:hypothetical protein
MVHLAKDITTFLEYLNDFPEFTDEVGDSAYLTQFDGTTNLVSLKGCECEYCCF